MNNNLENFKELDKWLDNATFDSNDIERQQMVVDADEVAIKLIELGNRIEELEKLNLSFAMKEYNQGEIT